MSDISYISSPSSVNVAEAIDIYVALGWGTLERYDAAVVARSLSWRPGITIAASEAG